MARMVGSGGGFNKPLTPGSHASTTGIAPHSGLSRNLGGAFTSSAPHLPQGGTSLHGAALVDQYKPQPAPAMTSGPGAAALPPPTTGIKPLG